MATNKSNSFNLFEQEREKANPLVATLNSRLVNLRKKNIAESMSDFAGNAHKLEHVKTISSIEFIDDSNSKNANAVWYSLSSMTKPTIWIASIDKADAITDALLEEASDKVKAIVLQGVYSAEVYERLASLEVPIYIEMNIEDAVRQAFYACEKNYVVLFSPGADSTSLTYRERGRKFQEAVAQL